LENQPARLDRRNTIGIFDSFGQEDSRFVTEKSFLLNSDKQVEGLPKILGVLREHYVDETNQRRLELFFYTNTIEKAKLFEHELKNRSYSVESKTSGHDDELFVITGWTTKMKIEENTLVNWVREMCELGYKYDCEFDGWGTNIKEND